MLSSITERRRNMQLNLKNRKISSLLLLLMLTMALAFSTTGCSGKNTDEKTTTETKQYTSSETHVLGEGKTTFNLTVSDPDGTETLFEIHTDAKTVGEALEELELIAGEEGDYGLYVKTVNGITADYDTDKTYWAFYVNDEYSQTGVDATKITEGDHYSFKVEK